MFAAVAPPPPFDQLRIGMPAAESRRLTGLPLDHGSWYKPLDYDGASADVTALYGYVYEIGITAPPSARDVILQRWGQPRATVDKYSLWIDDKTGWSAYVGDFGSDEIKVDFANVVPITAVVDAMIAMAGHPVSQVHADHPEWSRDHDYVALPAIDLAASPGRYDTFVLVHDEAGTASFTAIFHANQMVPGALDTVRAELAAHYGQPKPSRDKDGTKSLVYTPHLNVGIDKPDELFVEVK
jgi:hypothetical protein